MTLLSVVIPVFNRQQSLDSLLLDLSVAINKGGYAEVVEVIIIDDCSRVPAVVSVSEFVVTLLRNEENKGAPFSRERGLKLSKGKFVHFHDSDDSITENWLSKLMIELESQPQLDFLVTGREVHDRDEITIKSQKFFHRNTHSPQKVRNWLIYQNCIGPLGGVTFSRELLKRVRFLDFSSCQDWQMYLDAIEHAKVLKSAPDIHFIFKRSGEDRISNNYRSKILGHLQLSEITSQHTPFKRRIRLFYLFACRGYINESGSYIFRFYNNNRQKILFTFAVVSIYWRIGRNGIIKKS